ncbi:MAG: hypothetical protein JSU70_12345 [Phycisphaerales bacterium]|nr:MAG: hypothetical protein JSU70_12345 [Phycisphaerales bacterium]
MKRILLPSLVALALVACTLSSSCSTTGEHEPASSEDADAVDRASAQSSAPPPLVVDTDAPLLLDEPVEAEAASMTPTTEAAAENAACFVCHANYKSEPLAVWHAAANVGCSSCHGKSFAHRNDENNTTPPETMYPRGKIDAACGKCHLGHDVPAKDVIARWRQQYGGATAPETAACTDCHGKHRLKVRTVQWDKETGKLLGSNRGP